VALLRIKKVNIQQAIKAVTERRNLTSDEMTDVMRLIMTGETTPAQIGGFLIGLRMKGESVEEIAAAAGVMRELAAKVETDRSRLVDTVGTGGDASGTFNISTASAIVAAAAGARVAKHGNRSVSSRSGAADLLETAGVKIGLTPQQVSACLDQCGLGFMFAPAHHSAMKHAIGPRREMGVRTIFNVLGPLTNPAGAPNQLLGVFSAELVRPLVEVLQRLGSQHVIAVHSDDGLDEISIGDETLLVELKNNTIESYKVKPEDFGMRRAALDKIKVDGPEQSLEMIKSVLNNDAGPALDIVTLNAGATIYVSGVADSLVGGIDVARKVIASGAAGVKLEQFISISNSV
jgi:anthranilate phosphoribosyltransferase